MARRRRRGRNGKCHFSFKSQCPECGRMVKGHLRNGEYTGEYRCDCGAVMHAMVYRQFEWVKEGA